MERFDVSPIKINHLAFKLSKSRGKHPTQKRRCEACTLWITYALTLQTPTKYEQLTLL